ncbi:MAG: hypothetical protein JNM34_04720 [Chthonomonadaceae bacterium]|jgi:hypothetical protein|nr:hypothetical protein [Chthonomonadaceae bacterium]
MIRIVGIQRSDLIGQEFVLLQNQGGMRVTLRGHAVISDESIDGDVPVMHVFTDDVSVMPGQFVLLRTCPGAAHWSSTAEGQRVYYTYVGRLAPLWSATKGAIQLLAPQHSYCDRSAEAILV